eukprot:48981_1
MSAKLWYDAYKPSVSSGVYGSFIYADPIKFYPKPMECYLPERNNQYYITNKLTRTLEHIDFDIDEWYKHVHQLSFDTKFIAIHPKYAQSIIKFYRYRYCHAKISALSMEVVHNLRELQQLLDKEIKMCINEWYDDTVNEDDKGAFVRFSNRSPKDGHKVYSPDQNNEIKEEKSEQADAVEKDKFAEQDPNTLMIDFCRKSAKHLFVDNGTDAMALILSSERAFTDLLAILNAHAYPYKYLFYDQFTIDTLFDETKDQLDDGDELKWNEQEWQICNVSLAIRKWDTRIRDDLEFRCFVYDHKLRAISQYNHYCYFPELGDNALFVECIKKKICGYFERNIEHKVPYREYIVDIAIIILDEKKKENVDNLDCVVIELNPYRTSTGAGLFNWGGDEQQLKYAQEVEIRVHHKSVLSKTFVEHYLNDFEKYAVETPWYKLLEKMEKEITEYQSTNENGNKKDCVLL